MRAFVRRLSTPAEFCLILALGFGLSVGRQIWMLLHSESFHFTNQTLITNSLCQLLLLATVLWVGKIRGWSPATFGARISWKGTGQGVLLFLATFVAELLIMIPVQKLHPDQSTYVQSPLVLPVIFLASTVNPVWEELIESGYIIHSLQKLGLWPAVAASAAIRAIAHMYQGLNGILSLFVYGLVVGLAYWRWRQLWPIVLAHSLADFLGFTVFA